MSLDGRKDLDEFLPGLGDFKPELFHNVLTIEHYIEGLCFRHTVDVFIQSVLLVGAGCVVRKHFFITRELCDIFCRITQCVVYGLVSADGKCHIRPSSRKYRIQQCARVNDFYVDLDSRLGSEAVINHGLQDGALVTTGHNPDLNDSFIVVIIYIADCIVVNKEGNHEGFQLVPELGQDVCLILLHLSLCSAYYQVVDVQLGVAHVQSRGTEGSDVILEGGELNRDLIGLLAETIQLLCHCLGGSDVVCLLSAVCYGIVDHLVKSLCLESHCIHNLRIGLVDTVVSVDIRGRTGVNQDLSVDLVQSECAVLQFLKDRSQTSEGSFQSDGVLTLGQVEVVSISFLVAQSLALPVIVVGESNLSQFLEGNLAVDVNGTVGNTSARVVLFALNHDIVVSVFRNLEVPFDPLSGTSPCFAADIVQNSVGNTVRLCGG